MTIIYRIIPDYEEFLQKSFSMSETKTTIFISFTVIIVTIIIYMLLNLLLDKLFEEKRTFNPKVL